MKANTRSAGGSARARHAVVAVLAASVLTGALAAGPARAAPAAVPVQPDWTSAGQNSHNTRDAATGALLWRTKVASDPYAMITGSP
jgi:hypothetical protein